MRGENPNKRTWMLAHDHMVQNSTDFYCKNLLTDIYQSLKKYDGYLNLNLFWLLSLKIYFRSFKILHVWIKMSY